METDRKRGCLWVGGKGGRFCGRGLRYRVFFVLAIIVALGCGCTYARIEKIVDAEYEPKAKDAEVLLVEGDIDRRHKAIAFLTLVGSLATRRGDIDKRMMKEARRIGGDAVLFVTYSMSSGRYPHVTGVVVVYE